MVIKSLENRNRYDQLITEELDDLLNSVKEDEDEEGSDLSPVDNEDTEEEDDDDDLEKGTKTLYKRVQGLLNNDLFNHAAIIERLWGDKDATNRSLFRKKLNKERADDGTVYKFGRDELSDILSILSTAASEVKTATGKTKRQEKTGSTAKKED